MKIENSILILLLLTSLTLLPDVNSSTLKCRILTFNNMTNYNPPLPFLQQKTYVELSLFNNFLNSLSDIDT